MRSVLHDNLSLTDAYLNVSPQNTVAHRSASELGSRMMKRIKKKANWNEVLLGAGLDNMRLASEMNRMLGMQKVVYYEGKNIGKCEDSGIQMRATELLADLLGLRKQAVDVNHSGKIIHYDAVVYDAINGNGNGNGNGKSDGNGKSVSIPASLDG